MKTPIKIVRKDHEAQKFFNKIFKLIIFHNIKIKYWFEDPNFTIRLEIPPA